MPQEIPPSRRRIRNRFLATFLPLVLVAGVLATILTLHEMRTREAFLEVEQMQVLDTEQRYVQQATREVVSDLLVLAGLMADSELQAHPSPADPAATARKFLAFARSKPIYDQVRFLSLEGQEVLRINNPDGTPQVVAPDQLQNKSHRYYFSSALNLDAGEIYISPLDLNIEHNQVEIPHKPMIRLATPVRDSLGRKRGIVVLNYRAQNLLHELLATEDQADARLSLINAEGFWLHHEDRAREFGFMFAGKDSLNMARLYPEAWPLIRDNTRDFIETDAGFFGFTTVLPVPSDLVARLRTSGPSSTVQSSGHYFWKVVSFTPRDLFMTHIHRYVRNILIIMAGILVLMGLGSWLLARANERHRLADEALLRANDELENLVARRTAQLLQANEELKNEAHEKHLALIARDVAENRLRKQEKLRSLGSATASVAHDFRNILQPMRGYAQLALQGVPRDSEVAEDLQGVLDAVHRGTELANRLLTLGQGNPLNLQTVDLEKILAEVSEQTMTTAPSNLEVRWSVEEGCPTIVADPGPLHQALTNLCRNAIQAMAGKEGVLEIHARPDAFFRTGLAEEGQEEKPAVIITVRDTGPGIPRQYQDRIFEPYFTTKEGNHGTGLGLSTVYGIVDRHGGTIEVDSVAGMGTTFILRLPVTGPERQGAAST